MRAEFARLGDAELRATASKTERTAQWIALDRDRRRARAGARHV